MRYPVDWSGKKIRITVTVVLLALTCGLYGLNPVLFTKLAYLTVAGDIAAIVEILRSYGMWAMAVSAVLNILINILGFLPSIFISTANGVVFGIIPGVIISWLSESAGVIISFWLMRGLLRRAAERIIAQYCYLKKVDEFSGANGFKMMLLARALPYFPSGIITAVGAVSSIRFQDYALATLLGKLPATALEVLIGHDVVTYEQNISRLSLLTGMLLLLYLMLWRRKRRLQ